MENKEVAQLLLEAKIKLKKLPDKCKIVNLKQFIHYIDLNLQQNERFNKCLYCDGDNE